MTAQDRHSRKDLMDELYSKPRFPEAVDLWASFFAKTADHVAYSNWRHLNPVRQEIENTLWRSVLKSGDKVLDIGCGKGFFLKRVRGTMGPSVQCYGLDISAVVLTHAQKHFPDAQYVTAQGENLPFPDEHFEYVQIISTLQNVTDTRQTLREAFRVLKKGGHLYIVIHKPNLDPLLLASMYALLRGLARRAGRSKDYDTLPISQFRKLVFRSIAELDLVPVSHGELVSNLNVGFYRKLGLPLSFLMSIAETTNRWPLRIFKNLEYHLYKKQGAT